MDISSNATGFGGPRRQKSQIKQHNTDCNTSNAQHEQLVGNEVIHAAMEGRHANR